MTTSEEYTNLLFFNNLLKEKNVLHFSTIRSGGVSSGEFESLNMGNYSDDSSLNIHENRSRVARQFHIDASNLITPHQTHSNNVICIDKEFLALPNSDKNERLYNNDASVTQEKGFFLCATTADCVPILLYDYKHHASAAIHAGWKGTAGLIVQKTISAMTDNFATNPKDIIASIGPAINIDKYEVGDEVVEQLRATGYPITNSVYYINEESGKAHIDIKEINREALIRIGVPPEQIEKSDLCTYSNKELFFSARRQSINSGRMLTGIMLT